ncbi:hypothetical protein SO802_024825 [Lithocarpus litseifolius]|uniref:Uncharacterized protein n=1 Tax=Lithocarpus litseifolius TaxID=425828 RepID=A0AAW2CC99_9ROSI
MSSTQQVSLGSEVDEFMDEKKEERALANSEAVKRSRTKKEKEWEDISELHELVQRKTWDFRPDTETLESPAPTFNHCGKPSFDTN